MTWLDLGTMAVAFALIFPAELPDKTFIATLVLSTRYRRLPVWLGVSAAFLVQCAIAVGAGALLTLLPTRIVLGATTVLFAVASAYLILSGFRARPRAETVDPSPPTTKPWRIAGISFAVLFTAEWGDLSQILTAGLAASTASPVSVLLGAWLALITVAAIAVLAGSWLTRRVALWRIRLVSGVILAGLAIWSLVEFIRA